MRGGWERILETIVEEEERNHAELALNRTVYIGPGVEN